MRFILTITFVLLMLSPSLSEANTSTVARTEAQTLLEALSRHFSDIHTLSYTAERTTQGRRQSSKERWFFAYEAPGLVRVDYQYPSERHILLTTNTLYEYIPALRRALRTDLSKMTDTVRQATIKKTLARISLDGINPANFEEMVSRTTSVTPPSATPNIYRIIGNNPKFLIELDRQRKVLQTTDIYTPGNDLLLHSEASKFVEACPGFWYPQQVDSRYLTEQGFVNTSTIIRDITINTPLTNTLFQFSPPPHVTLETR
jgi:outer membrane lipoprotein-sorting protein